MRTGANRRLHAAVKPRSMKPTTRIAQIVATVRKVCYADDLDTRDLEGPSRTPTHLPVRLYLSLYTHT